jgi:hypothetical protein
MHPPPNDVRAIILDYGMVLWRKPSLACGVGPPASLTNGEVPVCLVAAVRRGTRELSGCWLECLPCTR